MIGNCIRYFKENIEDLKLAFISTFVVGFLTHGYAFFNLIVSHDSLGLYQGDRITMVKLGRYLQPIYLWFRGGVYQPTIVGTLSLIFVCLSSYLLFKIFDVKKKITKILICALMITNYVFTLTAATYIHDLDKYMLALLMSVLGVYLLRNHKNILFVVLCFWITLGIYQCYLSVALGLIFFLTIQDLLEKKDTKQIQKFLMQGVLAIALSLLVYFLLGRVSLRIWNTSASSGSNSIWKMFNQDSFNWLYQIFYRGYTYFGWQVIVPHTPHPILMTASILILFLCTMYLVLRKLKRLATKSKLTAIALLILLPLVLNVTWVLDELSVHELMNYAFFMVFVVALIWIERWGHLNMKYLSIVLVVIICFNNFLFANRIYEKKDIELRRTEALMTRIMMRIEDTEGYVPGETKLLFIGELYDSPLVVEEDANRRLGIGVEHETALTYTYESFIRNYWNSPYVAVGGQKKDELLALEQVKNMEPFPDASSVQMIDDCIVIKVSNSEPIPKFNWIENLPYFRND